MNKYVSVVLHHRNQSTRRIIMASGKVVVITGCSRGIGLGLVKEYAKRGGWQVVATCRNPDKSADQLQLSGSTTHLLPCDISNDESIEACVKAIQALGVSRVDLLINNAGVSNRDHPDDPADKVDRQEMVDIYNTNVAGPMAVTKVAREGGIRGGSSGEGLSALMKVTPLIVDVRCVKRHFT